MKSNCISLGKFEENCINEDAAIATHRVIAVSDGAGGGGLFAERWSHYLLDRLPLDTPICSAEELDEWIERIWEPYYNRCEADAKQLGGLSLDKFYEEGSFATLVAVWKTSETTCQWMSFGDSVAFHYHYTTRKLEHSFSSLTDFDKPPYLINCKDELAKEGFRSGTFITDEQSVVFAASDALAHYLIMMYEVAHPKMFIQDLNNTEFSHSRNENYVRMAKAIRKIDFEKDVLGKLLHCTGHNLNFQRHLKRLIRQGLLAHDDYSFALLT